MRLQGRTDTGWHGNPSSALSLSRNLDFDVVAHWPDVAAPLHFPGKHGQISQDAAAEETDAPLGRSALTGYSLETVSGEQ